MAKKTQKPKSKPQSKSELLSRFAMNLSALRTTAEKPQKEIAEKAKISISYLSMLERGERSPTFETIEALARAFKLADPTELLKAA